MLSMWYVEVMLLSNVLLGGDVALPSFLGSAALPCRAFP
jgi:hypothetical protein